MITMMLIYNRKLVFQYFQYFEMTPCDVVLVVWYVASYTPYAQIRTAVLLSGFVLVFSSPLSAVD